MGAESLRLLQRIGAGAKKPVRLSRQRVGKVCSGTCWASVATWASA
ncbi:MAG: hypothetical protein RLZZ609_653 [Cyanobacteriota bacterium]